MKFRHLTLVPLLAATFASAQMSQPYTVVDRWVVGGTGSWDYLTVDPAAHTLYLAHSTRVEVVDTLTGKHAGSISGLKGAHGIALDPNGQVGYISDGAANTVVVFDRSTLQILANIAVGTNPDGIAYEPTTRSVWAFNGRSKSVSIIDATSRKVVDTLSLPGKPEFPQVDGSGHIFVNIEDTNSILLLDAAKKSIIASWPMAGCESPSGLAIDTAGARLFAVCDGKKMGIVSTATGKLLHLATIGDEPDATAFAPDRNLAFSSNGGDGSLSVIDTAHGYKTIQTLATAAGARTMAYDASTDRIFVTSAKLGARPKPSPSNPHGRATPVPDTFFVMVIARGGHH